MAAVLKNSLLYSDSLIAPAALSRGPQFTSFPNPLLRGSNARAPPLAFTSPTPSSPSFSPTSFPAYIKQMIGTFTPPFGCPPVLAAGISLVAALPAGAYYYYTHQKQLLYAGMSSLPYFRKECLTPGHLGVDPERWRHLEVTAPDGMKTRGYALLHKDPKAHPTVVCYHGNGGNVGHYLIQAIPMFEELRFNVVMGSYRGCGLSDGSKDADSTFQWVSNHPELSQTPIVLFGTSLGGAVAARVAMDHLDKVKAVVLENSFTSVLEAVKDLKRLPSFLVDCLDPLTIERWETIHDTSRFPQSLPALFIASGEDVNVPAWHCRKLYNQSSGFKSFINFEGASHSVSPFPLSPPHFSSHPTSSLTPATHPVTTYQQPQYYTHLQNFFHRHSIGGETGKMKGVDEENVERSLGKCLPVLKALHDSAVGEGGKM